MWWCNFLLLFLLVVSCPVLASEEDTLSLGRKLLAENHCNGSCHQAKAPEGDPTKIYTRANAKVKSLDGLKRQVDRCVAAVGAQIASSEIDAVVDALNVDYYKFK